MRMKLSAIIIAVALLAGCGATAPPNTDPTRNLSATGRAAYNTTKIVKTLDVLRDVVAEGERQHVISPAGALKVIAYHKQVVQTMDAVPSGWKAVAESGLDKLKADLTAADWAQIDPFVNLLRSLYAAYEGVR